MMAKRPREASTAKQAPDTIQVLPMQLRIGDTFTDETGTWEIIGLPTTLRGGKGVRAKTQSPGAPQTRRDHQWPAHENVTVKRGAAT